MGIMERPEVHLIGNGAKYWEHTYNNFDLKAYIPASNIDGKTNNYTFRAPLLLVFSEDKMDIEKAIAFADNTGLSDIAAEADGSVYFVYPTCEGGWSKATQELYVELIGEVKMNPMYEDNIVELHDFFAKEFRGYFARGAIFRADIYSYGASADFVATHLLKTQQGEFLWGPGEITPAMCMMERLSVKPQIERRDIAVLSVGNSEEINAELAGCENLLIKKEADYRADFKSFVRRFKMWCGHIEIEPDFEELNMNEEAGGVVVSTSQDNCGVYKGTKEHKVGYFAYYNKDAFDKGPIPLVMGFHGGGDSSMYLTFVAEWYKVANKYGFLFVSMENHIDVSATETIAVIEHLKERYNIDEHRIYATGFSMGSGKTWDLFQEYPEVFAGIAPCSALFPINKNLFGNPVENLNTDISLPVFYSGGEESPLPELPFQAKQCLDRVQYASKVNKCKIKFDVDFADKDNWSNKIWGVDGERSEQFYDESRGSYLTVQYYDSEDGVCRTALASVSGQQHECRHHSCEQAWKFISQFSR